MTGPRTTLKATLERLTDEPNENGCRLFLGSIQPNGYGKVWDAAAGKSIGAHVASFKVYKGHVKKGENVCHHCDVRACVEPSHLFKGSHSDNMQDMVGKKRHRSQKLTPDQITEIRKVVRRPGRGKRDGNAIELATKYGVTPAHISHIANGHKWS